MEEQSSADYSSIRLEGRKQLEFCRYCLKEDSSKEWRISSSRLRVDDYELLMKRGWCRRGTLVRKPLNDITCCPRHPIWCDAMRFKISNGQKKAISIIENFLRTGQVPEGADFEPSGLKDEAGSREPGEDEGQPQRQTPQRLEVVQEIGRDAGRRGTPEQAVGLSPAEMRERKRQLKAERNRPKELEDHMKRVERREGDEHTLDVRVYSCSPLSPEIGATLNDESAIFEKYLAKVHKAAKGTRGSEDFQETCIETSLVGIDDEEVEAAGAPKFGTYHQQYWLDGHKLIAVGVVDLLPGCLSSVYFFNDPRYSWLNLGTFSALWFVNVDLEMEIAYVRNLQRTYGGTVPAYANLQYYTMGHYIHSSPKMNYKSGFSPSYLTCPVTYTWVPVDQCKRLLEQNKYSRLSQADVEDPLTIPPDEEVMVQLPLSEELTSALNEGSYTVEGDAAVITLADAKGLLDENDMELIHEWVNLVRNTGNMCTVCRKRVGTP
ncbi:Arginyl-tRNA--protein transferase 1 [Taenia solium]|eukprot:TsM_000951400 transcript=TsM_000951400 gene=TsM_000951400